MPKIINIGHWLLKLQLETGWPLPTKM